MLPACGAARTGAAEREVAPFQKQTIRLHFSFETAVPVIGHNHHCRVLLFGVVHQITHRAVALGEALFDHVPACGAAIGPARVDVLPRFVLQVIHQLEHHHQGVPAVAVAEVRGHRGPLMETA